MKELGISLLRWPGGNFSGEYRWRDGLLDADERAPLFSFQPIETNPHSGGYDFHEIGIDEFIALCREINAEPYNVKYWSLGNEFGHGHMEGLNTPDAYADKALRSALSLLP